MLLLHATRLTRFIEVGTVRGLDASCVARTKRPAFALRRDPEVVLPAGQLARLAGTYSDREKGVSIRVETVGPHLRVLQDEQPSLRLKATSPTRFRIEGMPPGFYVDFQLTEGRATACTLPWAPAEPLRREGFVGDQLAGTTGTIG